MREDTKQDATAGTAIAAATATIAALGTVATAPGLVWYQKLDKPSWQPPGSVFGPVWSVLYTLLAGAVITTRRRTPDDERPVLYLLFGSNLVLNLAWTVIFFRGRNPLAAAVEIVALEGTCVALVVRAWPRSRAAALALVPYALWVGFATALTWSIAARNR